MPCVTPILYFPLYYTNRNAATTDSRLTTTICGEETPIAPLDAFVVLDASVVLDVFDVLDVGAAPVEGVAVTAEEDDEVLGTASAC